MKNFYSFDYKFKDKTFYLIIFTLCYQLVNNLEAYIMKK